MSIQNSLSPLVRAHRPLRTVLVGTSLGEESDRVVRAGLAAVRAAGARIYLVHAVQLEPRLAGVGGREEIARCGEELRGQIERLDIAPTELAGSAVRVGAPYRVLLEIAEKIAADLVVVGATGSGPFAELLGSTAERLLQKAHVPVLVVRGELRLPPRRVLAPVDLSTLSGDAFHCGLSLLAQLAGSGETRVQAVHALGLPDASGPQTAGAAGEQAQRATAGELRRFVLENQPDLPFPVETAVLPGEARREILRELEEHPADLLVVGTHGRGGLDRLVLGSVASTAARKAPCSVLVVSPEAALEEGIAEAILARTTPAWHRAPSAA
ncbi:MAG: universal stress protein [Thermoanaerobaculia bacterium]